MLRLPDPRLEQPEHLGVLAARAAGQEVHDQILEVIVADADGVRVPQRALGRLGGRPLADAGHDAQPGQRGGGIQRGAFLEAGGDRRRCPDRPLSARIHA